MRAIREQVVHAQIGALEVDERTREVRRAGTRLAIQPKVFDVLVYLVHARDRVVARDELLRAVWPGVVVGPDSITRALREVRRVFGDLEVVRTYPGRGIRFVGPLAPVAGHEAPVRTDTVLVGRDEAIAAVDAALARLAAGHGALRVVLGAPGTGKSSLLAVAGDRARTAGYAVAQCTHTDLARTAAPAVTPTVLLCDDGGRDDVSELAAIVERAPVLIIVACCAARRREPATSGLLAAATRSDPAAVIALRPLTRAAIGELAQHTLGTRVSPAGIAKLDALVGGHPRFALHVLHLAREATRSLETLDALPASFADRLRELVAAHVGVVSPAAHALLAAISVLDEPFSLEVAAEVAELEVTAAADAIAEATEAGLLVEAPARWRFAQEVVRAVLERALAPSLRAACHARAAAALEHAFGVSPTQLERLARHYVAGASVAHAERALALVRELATLAVDARTFGVAARWLGLALDVETHIAPSSPTRRRELRLAHAKVLARDGDIEGAAEAFGAAGPSWGVGAELDGDAVRAAFAAIAPQLPRVVEEFYALLFARHPQLRRLFTQPATLQRRMFGEAIAALAAHADDPDWLDDHLANLGRGHAEYGVTDEMYDWARAAFLDALELARAPRRLPADVRAVWARTYDAIAGRMRAAAAVPAALTPSPCEPPRASAR